jgi:hypothetical protein
MSRRFQLFLLALAVVALTSAASHLTLWVLNIDVSGVRRWTVGEGSKRAPALVLGSSLTFFGVDPAEIAGRLNQPLANRWVASASACELEGLVGEVPDAKVTILGISIYDQNERILCDYRSEMVPLWLTAKDLWQSSSEWSFAKRLSAQYPLKYVRWLFPTAGRSLLVMIALKARLLWIVERIHGQAKPAVEADRFFTKPVLGSVEEWPRGQLLDRLTILRVLCQGKHEFNGPKSLALQRLLVKASTRGKVVVVVFPVSPEYEREFVTEKTRLEFENALNEAKVLAPSTVWVRLDQVKELGSNACFYDLAHMNARGRSIATDLTLRHLEHLLAQ